MRRLIGPAALVLLGALPARAAQTNLTWEQVQEAVAHGKAAFERLRTDQQPVDDADPAYVVDLGPQVGRAILFTEFSSVSLETRRWMAIEREPASEDFERILQPLRGRLRIVVTLVGDGRDFLRHYTARLLQRERAITPARWDVFRGDRLEGSARFLGLAEYIFPAADVGLEDPVTLVLTNKDGAQLRFDFDLGRLR